MILMWQSGACMESPVLRFIEAFPDLGPDDYSNFCAIVRKSFHEAVFIAKRNTIDEAVDACHNKVDNPAERETHMFPRKPSKIDIVAYANTQQMEVSGMPYIVDFVSVRFFDRHSPSTAFLRLIQRRVMEYGEGVPLIITADAAFDVRDTMSSINSRNLDITFALSANKSWNTQLWDAMCHDLPPDSFRTWQREFKGKSETASVFTQLNNGKQVYVLRFSTAFKQNCGVQRAQHDMEYSEPKMSIEGALTLEALSEPDLRRLAASCGHDWGISCETLS